MGWAAQDPKNCHYKKCRRGNGHFTGQIPRGQILDKSNTRMHRCAAAHNSHTLVASPPSFAVKWRATWTDFLDMYKSVIEFLAIFFVFFNAMNASAQTTINPEDLPFLPLACHIKWNPNSEMANRWTKILSSGGGTIGISHYCMGMKGVNDLYRGVDISERKNKISVIFNEFKYVEDRWPESHVLRPSIEISKGRVRLFQRKHAEAIGHFKKAIALDPNQADGYAALSDTLMEMGHRDDAYKLLKEALEKLPENRKLLLRVAEIENTNKKQPK